METTIVIPDMHVPHHNKAIIAKILKYAKDLQPTGIVILGDFLDMMCFASYSKGSLRKLKEYPYKVETDAGNLLLDKFDAIESLQRKDFIYGNHEDRIFRWLDTGDNGSIEGHIDLPEDALRLSERGWKVHTHWQEDYVSLGPLQVIHGTYCNIHTAKKHADVFGDVMFGHTHRFQIFDEKGRTAYNIGFLGDMDSVGFNYAGRAQKKTWRNGFATVFHDDDSYHVEAHKVENGSFCAGGKIY